MYVSAIKFPTTANSKSRLKKPNIANHKLQTNNFETNYYAPQIYFGNLRDFSYDKKNPQIIMPSTKIRKINPNIEGKFQNIDIPTEDGTSLKSWFIPGQEDKPFFLYLYGTGENKMKLDFLQKTIIVR
jgi:hypothetical protein